MNEEKIRKKCCERCPYEWGGMICCREGGGDEDDEKNETRSR